MSPADVPVNPLISGTCECVPVLGQKGVARVIKDLETRMCTWIIPWAHDVLMGVLVRGGGRMRGEKGGVQVEPAAARMGFENGARPCCTQGHAGASRSWKDMEIGSPVEPPEECSPAHTLAGDP